MNANSGDATDGVMFLLLIMNTGCREEQYEKPEGENDNYRYEYRIYMINPEDPRDDRYTLTETPY